MSLPLNKPEAASLDSGRRTNKFMQGDLSSIEKEQINLNVPQVFPRVISITGAKGGVGTTNIVANLGLAFSQMGMRVLILEANFGLGNLNSFLGLSAPYTIEDFFEKGKCLFDILTAGPGGMMIIPSSSGNQDLTNLDLNRKMFLLAELERLEPRVDILLIDAGTGFNSNSLFFNAAAQKLLILITPEPTSQKNASALIKVMAANCGHKEFMVLINQAKNDREAKETFTTLSSMIDRSLQDIHLEYAGFIPFSEKIRKAVRFQKTVLNLFPGSPVSRKFIDLAKLFLGNSGSIKEKENEHFFRKENRQVTHRFGVRTAFGYQIFKFQK
jgi:flagellar biosynthesis protein FlhG